jgi:hypothetical protein
LPLKWNIAWSSRSVSDGFGGIGEVAPSGDGFRTDQFLAAGGTGVRFLLSKKFHDLRTDFAWGKDNFTWSMGVGEAF